MEETEEEEEEVEEVEVNVYRCTMLTQSDTGPQRRRRMCIGAL